MYVTTLGFREAHKGGLKADEKAVSVANVTITNARRGTVLNISPNAFPAARYLAKRDMGDESPVEYIQVSLSPSFSQTNAPFQPELQR